MTEKNDSLLFRKVVERVQEFENELIVEGIRINGRRYNLKISNQKNGDGYLHLDFNGKDNKGYERNYRITIDKKGIQFTKENYDFGDCDSISGIVEKKLIVGLSDSPFMGLKKGEICWLERYPYKDEDFFRVPFIDIESEDKK
jgi:hypothetical protein